MVFICVISQPGRQQAASGPHRARISRSNSRPQTWFSDTSQPRSRPRLVISVGRLDRQISALNRCQCVSQTGFSLGPDGFRL